MFTKQDRANIEEDELVSFRAFGRTVRPED
ncbi:MAG: hypothetical protein ACRYFU_07555 [Janthinobacterium lividum]